MQARVKPPAVDTGKWSWPMYIEVASLASIAVVSFAAFIFMPAGDPVSVILKAMLVMVSAAAALAAYIATKRYRRALEAVAEKMGNRLEAWARLTYTRGFFKLSDPPLLAYITLTRGSGGRGRGPEPYFTADLVFYAPCSRAPPVAVRSMWRNGVDILTERTESSKELSDRLIELVGAMTKSMKCNVEVRTCVNKVFDPISHKHVRIEAKIALSRVPLSRLDEAIDTVVRVAELMGVCKLTN